MILSLWRWYSDGKITSVENIPDPIKATLIGLVIFLDYFNPFGINGQSALEILIEPSFVDSFLEWK